MNTLGWIMMTVSVGSVLALTAFCLFRVFALPPIEVEDLDIAPLDIDTGDTRQPD
jgi:hypothetical protein